VSENDSVATGASAQTGSGANPRGYYSPDWGYQIPSGPSSYGLPGPEPGIVWAGVPARFGALLVDAIVVMAISFATILAVAGVDSSGSTGNSDSPASVAMSLALLVFLLIYHPLCWYLFGQTVGQKALTMRIVRASNGAPIGLSDVLARYAIFFLVTLIFPLGVISAVMAAQDPFKRAWHDQVARTIVVRRRW
jgi:uncharacterized RDD family membrane protein YckC